MPCGRAETGIDDARQHPGINGRCQEIWLIQRSIHSAPSPEKLLRKTPLRMPLRDPHNPAFNGSINHQKPFFQIQLVDMQILAHNRHHTRPVKKITSFSLKLSISSTIAVVMRSRPSMVTLLQGLDSRSSRKFHPVFIIFLIFPNNMSICKEMRNILAFHFLFI